MSFYRKPHQLRSHPFTKLIPPMSSEAYEALREDIRLNGVRIPIILDGDSNIILDGVHRNKASLELGLKSIDVIETTFSSDDERRRFVYHANLTRRHLTEGQRVILAEEYRVVLEASTDVDGSVRSVAAKAQGVSEWSLQRIRWIKVNRPKIYKKLWTGKIATLAEADAVINKAKVSPKTKKPPKEKKPKKEPKEEREETPPEDTTETKAKVREKVPEEVVVSDADVQVSYDKVRDLINVTMEVRNSVTESKGKFLTVDFAKGSEPKTIIGFQILHPKAFIKEAWDVFEKGKP